MTLSELNVWLDSVQCTKPFTTADMSELHGMIKAFVPGHLVDVYFLDGEKVFVRLYKTPAQEPVLSREIGIT